VIKVCLQVSSQSKKQMMVVVVVVTVAATIGLVHIHQMYAKIKVHSRE
jgi:hypothetical protein